MKNGVSRQTLLLAAGIIWIFAGLNILRIGVMTWMDVSYFRLIQLCEVMVVFLLFFHVVFRRLFYKHTRRIEQKKDKNCPFAFFDARGWVVMIVMIALGILIRKFHLLPDTVISVFYVGLSLALIITGALFLRYWWKRRSDDGLSL